jgi:photoactive yellow protein
MAEDEAPRLDGDARTVLHHMKEVAGLTPEALDQLPFGVIRVDREGKVLAYNATEARLAGKVAGEVIGKNFFEDVAPCTNVQDFAGRFRDGIARGRIHETFPYRFPFETGPVHVMVTIHHEKASDHAWIFVDGFRPE